MEAVIIGGGIGGLCAGIALRRAGLGVAVYEGTAELREVGAGLSLWPNALAALDRLGLGAIAANLGTPDLHGGSIVTPSGRTLVEASMASIVARFGAPIVVVHRAEFQAALADALGRQHLHLGARLAHLARGADGRATAHFADGRAATGDILIGADGIRSAVRADLFPAARPRYAGYTAWRAIVRYPHARVPLWGEFWGRGARFGLAPVHGDRVYCFATANAPAGGDGPEPPERRKADLIRRFGPWHPAIAALLDAADPSAILRNDIEDLAPLPGWGRGPVTLLGDAAHAMTPNLGQGACQAIEDAVALGAHLRGATDAAAALRRYEAARRPRATLIQRRSRQIGVVAQWSHPLACALRDGAVRALPPDLRLRQFDPIVRTSDE